MGADAIKGATRSYTSMRDVTQPWQPVPACSNPSRPLCLKDGFAAESAGLGNGRVLGERKFTLPFCPANSSAVSAALRSGRGVCIRTIRPGITR